MSFPGSQRERYYALRFVFEEQECNSRRFCLAAAHPTNEKMPAFKAYAFLNCFTVASPMVEAAECLPTNGLFKRVSSLVHTCLSCVQ